MSHPLADIIRPHTISTPHFRYIMIHNRVRWLHNANDELDEDFQTYVIGKAYQKPLSCKIFKEMLNILIHGIAI